MPRQDAEIEIRRVREKFAVLRGVLDERQTRLWIAAEARALGRGGTAILTAAIGVLPKRVREGARDLDELREAPSPLPAREQRVRRPGAGRPRLVDTDPTLMAALEELVDPVTRGDPESPLRWTSKSKAKLASELVARGHKVSATMVGRLLGELGYSLQSNNKRIEGAQVPERDEQFNFINDQAQSFIADGQPVVSVDTKKKELVGDFRNAGKEWQPKGDPVDVRVHDFIDPVLGKAIPYGIYDTARNEAWVSVGTDHDTAEFAVATLLRWWKSMGARAYPEATRLLITADAGGSNSSRSHLWKTELQKFATETGLKIHVSHFPPGTSKWNKIEHRLFAQITQNWRGRPLINHETIVQLIANTRTAQGLRVRARLDKRPYTKGIRIPKQMLKMVRLQRNQFKGEWNYTIQPAPPP